MVEERGKKGEGFSEGMMGGVEEEGGGIYGGKGGKRAKTRGMGKDSMWSSES